MIVDEKIKKRATKHIIYEIQMLAFTWKKLNEADLDPLIGNTIKESFFIHAYNLFRFFYQGEVEYKNKQKNNRKPSDMIAEDYIDKKSYFRRNRTPKRLFKSLENKRNKQLAHLTYDRVKMKGWNQKIFERLWKTIDVFFISLPQEINQKWFANTIKKARKENSKRNR